MALVMIVELCLKEFEREERSEVVKVALVVLGHGAIRTSANYHGLPC